MTKSFSKSLISSFYKITPFCSWERSQGQGCSCCSILQAETEEALTVAVCCRNLNRAQHIVEDRKSFFIPGGNHDLSFFFFFLSIPTFWLPQFINCSSRFVWRHGFLHIWINKSVFRICLPRKMENKNWTHFLCKDLSHVMSSHIDTNPLFHGWKLTCTFHHIWSYRSTLLTCSVVCVDVVQTQA